MPCPTEQPQTRIGSEELYRSCANFKVENLETVGTEEIVLSQLSNSKEFDRVTFSAQVLKVDSAKTVGGAKTKQDVTLADHTSTGVLTVWEKDVGTLKVRQSYKFNRMVVLTFRGKTTLSFPPCRNIYSTN